MNMLLVGSLGVLLGAIVILILFFTGHIKLYTLEEFDYMWKNFKEEGGDLFEDYRKGTSEERREGKSS